MKTPNNSKKGVLDKIFSGREFRNIPMETLELKATSDSEAYTVRGYATTFNNSYKLYEDDDFLINEQIDKYAFNNCDFSDVIFQYNHEGRVYARISNDTLKLSKDENGLFVEAYLGGTVDGRSLYDEILNGYITKMSFGFTVRGEEITERLENDKTIYTRIITDIAKVYDVSAVSIPANDATTITARAFSDGLIAKAVQERNNVLNKQKHILTLKIKLLEET